MTQWDFQNKEKSRWTGTSSFVLKVPLRHLRPSVIYSVPCDWILQMAYSFSNLFEIPSGPTAFCVGNISKSDETYSRETRKSDEITFGGVWTCVNG